ncbi:hypothetical protein HanIR_Chr03g0104301 [Helianthus annuus]|nr:hypothetical protein HanIR_Chr03g0104301 [Helianthus annuus]
MYSGWSRRLWLYILARPYLHELALHHHHRRSCSFFFYVKHCKY